MLLPEIFGKSGQSFATLTPFSRFKRRLACHKHGRILSRFILTPRSAPAMTRSMMRTSRTWGTVPPLSLDSAVTTAPLLTCPSSRIDSTEPRVRTRSALRSTANVTQAGVLYWPQPMCWSTRGTKLSRRVEVHQLRLAFTPHTATALFHPSCFLGHEPCSIKVIRWSLRDRLWRERAQRRLCRWQARDVQRPSRSSAHACSQGGRYRHAHSQH